MSKEAKPVCSHCGSRIRTCDWCGRGLAAGDTVICHMNSGHFCSEECLRKFTERVTQHATVKVGGGQ